MKLSAPILFVQLLLLSSKYNAEELTTLTLTDYEYDLMPPIFQMDDFDKCRSKNDIYCKLTVQLKPLDETTAVWKTIKKTTEDTRYYNHDLLHRAICFSREFDGKEELFLRKNATKLLEHTLKSSKLIPLVKTIKCRTSYEYVENLHIVNITWLILASYLAWISFATLYDVHYSRRKNPKSEENHEGNNYIVAFSLLKNWGHFTQQNRGENYSKLKSIQGIRTITMMLVIYAHTNLSVCAGYVENTKYIEGVFLNNVKHAIGHMILFAVQTDFLISAWLLAIHLHEIVELHGSLSLKHCCVQFLNRVFRLLPCVAFMVLLHRSSFLNLVDGPISDILEIDEKACRNNWWMTLFFVNNYLFPSNICNAGSWYLSTDTQLYIISLIVFYVMNRYEISSMGIFYVFIISLALHFVIIYLYNLDIIFRLSPNVLRIEVSFNNSSPALLYTGTHCSMATYMMGLCFGTIYSKYKHKTLRTKKVITQLWLTSFLVFPLLAIWISTYTFNKTNSALVGAFIRPLFAFGVGFGILGMSFNIGGIIKSFLESRPLELLSNLTFSTYVFHFSLVFGRTVLSTSLFHVSFWMLFKSSLHDIILSFLVGFVMYFLVEQPGVNIRNMLLPQIAKKSRPTKAKD